MQTTLDLDAECDRSNHGRHEFTHLDKWPERAQDGRTEWANKFYCIFCLSIEVVRDREGGSVDH